MGKQSIGLIGYNHKKRIDTYNSFSYPQRPIVATRTSDVLNYNILPSGMNAMLVDMSYSGYDIEDAIILNKASIDRGFGRTEVYKHVKLELGVFHPEVLIFHSPLGIIKYNQRVMS